jgi:hypothetical protein
MQDSEEIQQTKAPRFATARVEREEFELACIREFSHSGLILGVGVSPMERRERIRAAILRENKAHLRWRDSAYTYADVFTQSYRRPLEASESPGKTKVPIEYRLLNYANQDELGDDEEEFEGDDGLPA